ncbi:pyocin activator PrtN family protein [Aerobium aerolatum]|uniref:Pyocin activator protein PrtN n=1 Tax=Aquamicrobium aerolatum DSM 21857 TaxID=1121003 RepID=A0A1I3KY02_9HYPH|nr:pyocin activator PrtN family protein [Aquamicrobium aerolatum]SFI77306.1 Pyocin activator protein PrtN [Aquamicrobium aerolatum DSM 21857]
MNTAMILVAQYGKAIIPVAAVAHDYFDLTAPKFIRKIQTGEIPLPLVRMEASQKAARGVHVSDLAAYIDRAREDAKRIVGEKTMKEWRRAALP